MCMIHLPLNTALGGFEKKQNIIYVSFVDSKVAQKMSVTCTFLSLVVHYFEAK